MALGLDWGAEARPGAGRHDGMVDRPLGESGRAPAWRVVSARTRAIWHLPSERVVTADSSVRHRRATSSHMISPHAGALERVHPGPFGPPREEQPTCPAEDGSR